MLNIRAGIIELNPRVLLTLLRIHVRKSRHSLALLLEHSARPARNRDRLGKHTNLATIVLKDKTFRKRRNQVRKLIVNRIREPRRLGNPEARSNTKGCLIKRFTAPLRDNRKLGLENLIGGPKVLVRTNLIKQAKLRDKLNALTGRTRSNCNFTL